MKVLEDVAQFVLRDATPHQSHLGNADQEYSVIFHYKAINIIKNVTLNPISSTENTKETS